MFTTDNAESNPNPVFIRHDLMVELGRLEMAIEDADARRSANDPTLVEKLRNKHATIAAALQRLTNIQPA